MFFFLKNNRILGEILSQMENEDMKMMWETFKLHNSATRTNQNTDILFGWLPLFSLVNAQRHSAVQTRVQSKTKINIQIFSTSHSGGKVLPLFIALVYINVTATKRRKEKLDSLNNRPVESSQWANLTRIKATNWRAVSERRLGGRMRPAGGWGGGVHCRMKNR